MFSVNRWWDRYRAGLVLTVLAMGGAWYLRETQAIALSEVYRLFTFPLQSNQPQQDQLLQAQTWELQQRLAELETQNQQLKTLLRQPEVAQSKSIAAPVIGRGADHWWQHVIIGKGSQDGVQLGAPVKAPGGLVGRVIEVTPHTSRILLLTDPTSRVGVLVGRKREMGILQGRANQQAVLEFFDKAPKVQPGDVVMTSSLSSLFPAGIPVGRIIAIDLRDRAKPHAIVELTAPMSQLEWVMVSTNAQTIEAVPPGGS